MSSSMVRKVGLISCSGEELPEGTVSRIAARLVLEELRPLHTVTLCLPLFLAGGEAERAFARNQPTITIDGCDKLCARRATAAHSGKPAASFIVSEFIDYRGFAPPTHRRILDEGEMALTRALAEEIAAEVDVLVDAQRSGRLDSLIAAQEDDGGKAGLRLPERRAAGARSCNSRPARFRSWPWMPFWPSLPGKDGLPMQPPCRTCWRWSRSTTPCRPTPKTTTWQRCSAEYQSFLAHQEKPA